MGRFQRRIVMCLLPKLCQPPPDADEFMQLVIRVLMIVLRPPITTAHELRTVARLFSGDINLYEGRRNFRLFATNRLHFYNITGETPETFINLVNILHVKHCNRHKLSVRNRVLLFLICYH